MYYAESYNVENVIQEGPPAKYLCEYFLQTLINSSDYTKYSVHRSRSCKPRMTLQLQVWISTEYLRFGVSLYDRKFLISH